MSTLIEQDTSGVFVTQAGETELLANRTRRGKQWRVGEPADNRYRCAVDAGAIHYQDDPIAGSGDWHEVDLSISMTPAETWDAEMVGAGYSVRLWQSRNIGGHTIRCIAQFRRGGSWFGMAPLALLWVNSANEREVIASPQAVAPVIDNEQHTITWPNAFGADLDFRYNLSGSEFAKVLILRDASALPAPTISTTGLRLLLVMGISWDTAATVETGFAAGGTGDISGQVTDAWTPDETEANLGRTAYRDTFGRGLWWVRRPIGWDSAGADVVEERGFESVAVDWELRRHGTSVFALFSVPATILSRADVVYPVFIDTAISEEQVGQSSDDASERDDGSPGLAGTYVIVNYNTGSHYTTGVRFQTVPIPQGATINTATLSCNVMSDDDPRCDIYCEDEDDTSTFTTSDGNVDGRTKTSSSTAWSDTGIGSGWQNAPDVSGPVGEVVARVGWASNNNLVFLIASNAVDKKFLIRTWDYDDNSYGVKFNCDYTAAGGVQTMPIISRDGIHSAIFDGLVVRG